MIGLNCNEGGFRGVHPPPRGYYFSNAPEQCVNLEKLKMYSREYQDLLAVGATHEEAIEQIRISNQPKGFENGYRNQDRTREEERASEVG